MAPATVGDSLTQLSSSLGRATNACAEGEGEGEGCNRDVMIMEQSAVAYAALRVQELAHLLCPEQHVTEGTAGAEDGQALRFAQLEEEARQGSVPLNPLEVFVGAAALEHADPYVQDRHAWCAAQVVSTALALGFDAASANAWLSRESTRPGFHALCLFLLCKAPGKSLLSGLVEANSDTSRDIMRHVLLGALGPHDRDPCSIDEVPIIRGLCDKDHEGQWKSYQVIGQELLARLAAEARLPIMRDLREGWLLFRSKARDDLRYAFDVRYPVDGNGDAARKAAELQIAERLRHASALGWVLKYDVQFTEFGLSAEALCMLPSDVDLMVGAFRRANSGMPVSADTVMRAAKVINRLRVYMDANDPATIAAQARAAQELIARAFAQSEETKKTEVDYVCEIIEYQLRERKEHEQRGGL